MNNAVCITREKAALQELLGEKIEYRTQNWAAGKKTLKCYYCKNCLQFFCYNSNIFFFLAILSNCVVFLQCNNWAYCLAVLHLLMWAAVQMPCMHFYICVLRHVVHMESILDHPFVTLQFPSNFAGFEIAEDRSVTLYCTGPGIGLSDKCPDRKSVV